MDEHQPPSRGPSRPTSRRGNSGTIRGGFKSIDATKDEDRVNEASPLLAARVGEDFEHVPPLDSVFSPSESDNSWVADAPDDLTQETKSSWYLFLLTLSMAGLQIAWSVEISNGSPYLLGLGISKSVLALVWIAGPLSGTLVQPYVGIRSDRCRSRFGKRRPFIVGGAIATSASLLVLSWTREIVSGFLGIFGASPDSGGVAITAICLAVVMIYVLDFAINVIQAGVRAFIVDCAPTHQQESANAWAVIIAGVGNIIGYLFGYFNLPEYLWFFGDTQFKILCVLASLIMLITISISCLAIHERDPRLEGEPSEYKTGIIAFFKSLYHSVQKLPPQISKVCQVQFFAWIGWFPFLFYITTYIGEIYVEPYFADNPHMTEEEIDQTWQRATRIGTFALFMQAIVTFIASIILPLVVANSYRPPTEPMRTPMMNGAAEPTSPNEPTSSISTSASGYFGYAPAQTSDDLITSKPSRRLSTSRRHSVSRFFSCPWSVEIRWLTLRRAWLLSHLMFTLCTWLTFLPQTTTSATVLVSLVGIPWALTNWAPFALIAAEISKRDAIRRGTLPPPSTREGELLAHGEDVSEGADQAGVVLGIHNVAVAAPQVVATLVSSAIFKALQKPRGSVGDESVAWVLRFGGLSTLVAAWLTRRVGEERSG